MSVTITNWKAINGKNTLRAFFTVELPSGMAIHNCSLHERNGQRWIGMPAEKRTNEQDGAASYKALIEFTSTEVASNFRRQVMDALKAGGLL